MWRKVGFCNFLLTSKSFVLYTQLPCCYTYSRIEIMSTQNDYQRCLQKLATALPKGKAALVRSLLPGIEAALTSGQTLKDIWQALETEGLQVSYHTFQMAVWRAKRKRTAANRWEKEEKASDTRGPGGAAIRASEERDPLANLKRLEENRPGFQWRGTQKVQKVVNGKEDSSDKNQR
jgi:hypothetical protein